MNAWCVIPTLPVTPVQLMRPGIGQNTSCALGDCLTSRPKGCSRPRELWFSIYSCACCTCTVHVHVYMYYVYVPSVTIPFQAIYTPSVTLWGKKGDEKHVTMMIGWVKESKRWGIKKERIVFWTLSPSLPPSLHPPPAGLHTPVSPPMSHGHALDKIVSSLILDPPVDTGRKQHYHPTITTTCTVQSPHGDVPPYHSQMTVGGLGLWYADTIHACTCTCNNSSWSAHACMFFVCTIVHGTCTY